MADEKDPFAEFIKKEEPQIEVRPFTSFNRFVASTLFDTQPKRRAAYVKRFGYELSKEDDNLMRPIGSKGPYNTQIDPGGWFNISQYKDKPLEAIPDAVEGALDLIQGAITEAAGDLSAVAAGFGSAAATGGAAIPALPVILPAARSAGRASAFQVIDRIKGGMGDLLLDEKIPIDDDLRLFQTGLQAVAPEVAGPLLKGAGKVGSVVFKKVGDSFANMLNLGKGKVSEIIRTAIAKNPDAFSKMESIEQGAAWLKENFVDALSGKSGSSNLPSNFNELGKESLFNKKLFELSQAKKVVVSKLDNVPQLNAKASDIIELLEGFKGKVKTGISTNEGKDKALEKIDLAIKTITDRTGGKPDAQIPFSFQDQLVSDLQKDAYAGAGDAKSFLKNLSGEVNGFLKEKVKTIKPTDADGNLLDYSGIKEQEAKVFTAFEKAADHVNEPNLMSTLVSGEYGEVPRAATKGTPAFNLTDTVYSLDDALGTGFGDQLQSGQIHAQLYKKITEGPKTQKGFVRKSIDQLSEFIPGAGTYALTKNPYTAVGVQAATTLAKNAIEGALDNPTVALKGIAASDAAAQALPAFAKAITPAAENITAGAIQPVAKAFGLGEEEDPFAEFIK